MRRFFTLCLAAIASITMISAQQIVADGGLISTKAPANTIAALEAAAKAGYAVKCDVNLAADGTVVVVEGPWLGKTGDPDRMNIQRSDYAILSSKLLANGEAVPTLDAYLDKVVELGDIHLIIEIKEHATPQAESELARAVVTKVKEHKLQNSIDYQSSRQHICNELKRYAASSTTVYFMGNNLTPEYVEGLGFSGISYTVETFKRIPRWINEAHKLGLKVAVRGVISADNGAWAKKSGADAIITTTPTTIKK